MGAFTSKSLSWSQLEKLRQETAPAPTADSDTFNSHLVRALCPLEPDGKPEVSSVDCTSYWYPSVCIFFVPERGR